MPDFLDLHAGASLLRHVDFVSALICLLIFAGLLVYFDAFCRAMAPRGGTLEWIAMYDRAPLSFGGLFSRYGRRDYVPMLVFSALSAGLIAFGAVRIARGGSIAPASILLEPDSLLRGLGGCALFSGLSLLPCYALLRRLSGRTDAAALSTALFAVTLVPSGAPYSFSVPCLLLSAVFFVRFVSAEDARLRASVLPLIASGALFGLAVWAEHTVLWFGIGYVILLVFALVLRVRAHQSVGAALLTLLFFVLGFAVPLVLICLPTAILGRGMAFPAALMTSRFWRFVWVRTLSFRIWIDPLALAGTTALGPLLWWGGLLAMFCAAACAVTRRDGRALVCTVLYLAGTLVWVFSGSALGAAACALTLCFVFTGLLSRGRAALAYGYGAACFLCSTVLPVLAYLL